jgi:hypothetical protein
MSIPKAGEIIHAGQILHPPFAEALGSVMLDHYGSLPTEFGSIPYVTKSPRQSEDGFINFGEPAILVRGVYQAAHDRFEELLRSKDAPHGLNINADVVVGTAGSEWHVDQAECRLLINLGSHPQDLLVSTAAREGEIDESNTHKLTIVTGEGIYLDSYYDENDRLFHRGLPSKNKVFLRMVASVRYQRKAPATI